MPTLEVTTMVGCPLMCTFCPQDKLKASYGDREKYLQVDDFRTILDAVPRYVRIDFSGMAEPWANPSATVMLQDALERGFNVAVYTTLYGMLDPERVAELLIAHREQVEALVIHLPDANGNMRGFKATPGYKRALKVIWESAALIPNFSMMTMDADRRVHPSLSQSIAGIEGWFPVTRAGNLDESAIGTQSIETPTRHTSPVTCSMTPFYDHNVLLPNGDVVLCCMDYSVKHKLGNLLTQDYRDLFGGHELARLHKLNTDPSFNDDSLCKSCSRAKAYELRNGRHQFWEMS